MLSGVEGVQADFQENTVWICLFIKLVENTKAIVGLEAPKDRCCRCENKTRRCRSRRKKKKYL
jgi:hypothetical protein